MEDRTVTLPRYDTSRTYEWNYQHPPEPIECQPAVVPGDWTFCGRSIASPLGMPAGPLLNGRWLLYYASLGFDVLTYKTVRSRDRECYPLPNLQPVLTGQLTGTEDELPACDNVASSWAVSFGMPSRSPEKWREDVRWTRDRLASGKLLNVSVVASEQPGWTLEDLAGDYAQCAAWAVESGADTIETNFSCPNVTSCDGQLFQNPDDAARVAERVREAIGQTPYIAKLGHVTDQTLCRQLVEGLSPFVDAFAMTNSVAARVRTADGLLFDGQRRGICGAATRTASIEQTRLFHRVCRECGSRVELIGVGGVETAEHVREYLAAGASHIQIATAAMLDPGIALTIRRDLAAVAQQR